MTEVPFIPTNAPFSKEQRAWLNGFLAGLFANSESAIPEAATVEEKASVPLLICYGSQTGTAEMLAKQAGEESKSKDFKARVVSLEDASAIQWAEESLLLIITSTWGDGDPPDNAVAFWDWLQSDPVPDLSHLKYSVLALGDKNYEDFCGAGRKFDEKLEALGARRIHPRVDCDVDYESAAREWMEGVWKALAPLKPANDKHGPNLTMASKSVPTSGSVSGRQTPLEHSRKNPFPAKLLTNRKLNGAGSKKDTRHFEISLKNSGLVYEPGDALGVFPMNCPELIEEILRTMGWDGEEATPDPNGGETSLRKALLQDYVITTPNPKFLKLIADVSKSKALADLLAPGRKQELAEYLYGKEMIDFLLDLKPGSISHLGLVETLKKLQPRLYSIASSLKAHPEEVHLTVAAVRYESHGRSRKGVCSTFLADRVQDDSSVPVFLQPSKTFRLPADSSTPIIMVGPGTGVAPFRAFLEERRAIGAAGKHWLFFGDQHAKSDFLYEEELMAFKRDGILTRLDTAFSRDQAHKIYAQDRMKENAAELWKWLEEGAHFYVCGDAKRMAKDVDAALHETIATAGGLKPEAAAEYVKNLKKKKRYQRDVY